MWKWSSFCLLVLLLGACYQPERNCKAFKTGTFTFTAVIDGEEKTTTFVRDEAMEVDYFEGKKDTSSIRWLNDCEYIVKKINPKSRAEEKSIHMKILSTDGNSYTFEYSIVGSSQKSRGTAIKIKP
ncbi:DNA topoisomerase IV [Poritiphilus sp. M415]|uniref:DNA topoisomerase IV n=1 Tax=Lentiprolixibacter aurantiacus TaxID=2993939 RepID=A0AAE3MLH1_9FLAO|nr:DNA topoisomerase IV [Lentiprolixibacter aurantiacus]MCX2719511.1 DNA topoisomerase IV [Lentiprolixibacter aurantiacus]